MDMYTYIVKEPKQCSDMEIENFHQLVTAGGKVSKIGLINRIKNCRILGFCIDQGTVVGISAIKRPLRSYVEGIIEKAQLEHHWTDLNYEMGYSFTIESYRRQGISSQIKSHLLKFMESDQGRVFSTTAIPSSQRFLKDHGFVQAGRPYNGVNDKNIIYLERLRS